jgi:type I restriction enzyme R subunit
MLDHYLKHVFPNRFKAQVVTVSRLAAIRYKLALEEALKQKVEELTAQGGKPEDIALLNQMKVEAVISAKNNDKAFYKPYTDEDEHEKTIKSFKLPFDKTSEDGIPGDVGMLVVQSMLITGFDAPVEQVMYLDNVIKDHNLLQAIARVNRVSAKKSCGYIVDYVGVTRHLREALAAYDEKDQQEILDVVRESSANLDMLKYVHGQVKNFFQQYDIPNMADTDACVDVLADEEVRDDFIALVRSFNKAMDRVLPDPEALRFVGDLKVLAWISQSARNRYRDEKLSLREASRKIREIVDEFLVSKGVDPKIPPLPIFSPEFKVKLGANKSARATAEEIEHAIRQHINENAETDPEFYKRLAEKLEKVLAEYRDNWDRLAKELEEVLDALKRGRENENNFGFNPRTELPFLALLKRELYGKQDLSELSDTDRDLLVSTTTDLLEITRRETKQPDFWENYSAQKRLKSFLLNHMLTAFKSNRDFIHNRNQVAEKILELASYNRLA